MQLPDGILKTREGVYVLREDSHISRWVEYHRRLDIAEGEIAKFARYIPVGGTVLDAGASIGDHSATYAKLVGESGRVFALEPNPMTYKALALNFGNVPQVATMNLGLSDCQKESRMIPDLNVGASYVSDSGTVPIHLTTIDALGLTALNFVHLDCEGFEADAIRGGRQTIAKFRPVMVIEINRGCLARRGMSEGDVTRTLMDIEYRLEEIEPGYGPHMEQRDVICFPL